MCHTHYAVIRSVLLLSVITVSFIFNSNKGSMFTFRFFFSAGNQPIVSFCESIYCCCSPPPPPLLSPSFWSRTVFISCVSLTFWPFSCHPLLCNSFSTWTYGILQLFIWQRSSCLSTKVKCYFILTCKHEILFLNSVFLKNYFVQASFCRTLQIISSWTLCFWSSYWL